MSMVEQVARAIAEKNGDDYDKIPQNKKEWVVRQGMFQGRFRDVNEPYQVDYYDMAEGAIKAMREPTPGIIRRLIVWANLGGNRLAVDSDARLIWEDVIDAALGD